MRKKIKKKILCYISHPSSGKLENTLDTECIIKTFYSNSNLRKKLCLVSPIHNYGFMYDSFEYYIGLSFCTDLLKQCDIMLVFGDWESSIGCNEEISVCKEFNIPYIIIGNSENLEHSINEELLDEIKRKVKHKHK